MALRDGGAEVRVVRNANRKPREGWAEAMTASAGDDQLSEDDLHPVWEALDPTQWDEEEWEWGEPVSRE
jgi:hypothetical protein